MPQPEGADGKLKVARSIQESAVAQCVAAYSTNEAKTEKKPGHQYEIKYRSLKKNYTETIQIQKDNDNTVSGRPTSDRTMTARRSSTSSRQVPSPELNHTTVVYRCTEE